MHKTYPRLKNIRLPVPNITDNRLVLIINNRQSFRDFSSKPIKLEHLSDILNYSAGVVRNNPLMKDNPLRAYPSAGAKFPLEMYVLAKNVRGINPGLYHYNPTGHTLEILSQKISPSSVDKIWIKQQPWFKKASVILIITSIFTRTTEKYGRRGIFFPYIEAGHLGQNVYLLSTMLKIGCCAIGMLHDQPLIDLLDINPREEYPIYYFALGT